MNPIEIEQAAETARIERLKKKVAGWANRILEAARQDASNTAKNSSDWRIRNHLEEIQLHYNGYAEPGYTDPDCGIVATGNWNDITDWRDGERLTISNVPSRIAKLFERLGIETEWSDEWTDCSHCGKVVRTQPDSMSWHPSYTMGEGEIWCHECDDTDDESDESDEESDEDDSDDESADTESATDG